MGVLGGFLGSNPLRNEFVAVTKSIKIRQNSMETTKYQTVDA